MAGRRDVTADPSPGSAGGGRRPRVLLVLAVAGCAVAVAAGLAITSGSPRGHEGSASAIASGAMEPADSALADLSLVPVVSPPTASTPVGASSVAATAPPSTTASPSTAQEIKAKRIRIKRLGIDLRIIEGDGVDAPIGKAAHYPGTAWPGGGSNIFIYGHAREGMFLSLWKARAGDVVELDLVDGTARRYIVDDVLPKVPWDAVKYVDPTNTEQLTLQTSTSYHPTSPRFIVIAHPVP